MSKINVAILGFGLSGSTFHVPLINEIEGFKITHILSRQKDLILKLFPELIVTTNLDEILENDDIKLIINTLPNSEHYSVTKQCLLAGKHVVVEKPFVIDSTDGEELINIAQKNNLILSVYHNRRFDNGFLTLKEQLAKLGNIYLYEAYFDRFRPEINLAKWREQDNAGSGILYDLGAHLIDQAINLFGTPQTIFADITKQRPHAQAIDYFNLILTYPNHRVILGSSSVIANPRPVVAAYGDKGSYIKSALDPQEAQLRSGITPSMKNYGKEGSEESGILSQFIDNKIQHMKIPSKLGCYQKYYQQLYTSICNNSIPPVTSEGALTVIKVIEKAQQSHTSGKIIPYNG